MRRPVSAGFLAALFVCFSVTAALPTASTAQPSVFVEGHVGASSMLAPDPLPEFHNSGYSVGGGAGVRVLPFLEVLVEGAYSQFPFNEDDYLVLLGFFPDSAAEARGSEVTMLSGAFGGRFLLTTDTNVTPFLGSGVGVYRRTIGTTEFHANGTIDGDQQDFRQEQLTQTAFGYYFEVGVRFQISPAFGVYFAPRYVTALTDLTIDEEAGVTTRQSVSTRYIPFRLGLNLTL